MVTPTSPVGSAGNDVLNGDYYALYIVLQDVLKADFTDQNDPEADATVGDILAERVARYMSGFATKA